MQPLYDWFAAAARAGTLPASFEYAFIIRGILAVLLVAPLLGGLSHLVVARRLAFFSSALGHAALTGLTLGLLLGEPINSAYGGILGFCLLTAVAMVFVRRHSSLPPDTLIGVFLSLTLGLGICLLVAVTKRFNIHQIESVMFGSLLTVTDRDLLLLLLAALTIGALLLRHYNELLLDSSVPILGKLAGNRAVYLEYLFVVLLTMAIVVSLKIIGALLVESLVVVPAAAARNLSHSIRGYLILSILLALIACLLGLFLSTQWLVPTGGAIVLSIAALFFLTMGAGALRRAR
jgi:zinc transport system permease protein